tara:strand:+ start:1030 stop:1629 length:600 start_codon:yes stop_codon:yes gene_type:complete
MRKLNQALTIATMAVCLALPTTVMAAGNQAHVGLTNTSGATYINNTRYSTSGTGVNIGSDITISKQLGLMLGYRTATVNSSSVSSSISHTNIGMRYRLDNTTSTYFSANRAAVSDNSETLFMLGAMHHMNLGGASTLVFSAGTSTSNLLDDLALGADFSAPIMDALVLNLGYQSNVTSLGKSSTTATSSGFNISINSRF